MKSVQLTFVIRDDNALHSVVFDNNDTGIPSDSNLLRNLAITLLKSIALNKEDCEIQDVLNQYDIKRE